MSKWFVFLMGLALPAQVASDSAEVLHEMKRCVSYHAAWSGDFLVIRAAVEPGWKTFAMDNKRRAAERLAGKPSLGIDQPTEIELTGLRPAGAWFQTPPKDFSKPEIRWFTFGYDKEAVFAVKVRRVGAAKAGIRGQACTETTCKNIDVTVSVPAPATGRAGSNGIDVRTLVPVRM